MPTFIILGIIVVFIFIAIGTYNNLAKLKINVDDGFSTMDVYLKKRYDLIPNLVESIKGYEAYESNTLKEIVAARQQALSAGSPNEVIAANQSLSAGIGKLFSLAVYFPVLKALSSYLDFMETLGEVEDDIANARLYYNGNVKIFNKAIVVFPTVLFAGMLGYKAYDFFEATSSERENVKVNFRT